MVIWFCFLRVFQGNCLKRQEECTGIMLKEAGKEVQTFLNHLIIFSIV